MKDLHLLEMNLLALGLFRDVPIDALKIIQRNRWGSQTNTGATSIHIYMGAISRFDSS